MEGQLKNGTILTSESGNKYTVVNLLGAGGQGEVYDVECDGNMQRILLQKEKLRHISQMMVNRHQCVVIRHL